MPANQAAAAEIAGVEQNLATDRFARKADIRHWTIKKGRPLSETIAQWCAQAKYNEPVYLATNDPVADADFTFEGDLISALGQLADALSNLPDEHIPYIYVSPASKLVQISDVPQPTAAQINLRKTEK